MIGSKYDKMSTAVNFQGREYGFFIALFIFIFSLFLNLSKCGKKQFQLIILSKKSFFRQCMSKWKSTTQHKDGCKTQDPKGVKPN